MDIKEKLKELNSELEKNSLLRIELVSPDDLVGAEVNARYMKVETMKQLTDNVKETGSLESVPLVWLDDSLPEGKFRIISGHHRIDAAKGAGLKNVLVMVSPAKSIDDVISKQLSHNALVGIADKTILSELFNSIKDISKKMATGIDDMEVAVNYQSLNFKAGTFKTMTLLFVPESVENFDDLVDEINSTPLKSSDDVRVASDLYYDEIIKLILKVKKLENIKSTGSAFNRIIDLAKIKLDEIKNSKE